MLVHTPGYVTSGLFMDVLTYASSHVKRVVCVTKEDITAHKQHPCTDDSFSISFITVNEWEELRVSNLSEAPSSWLHFTAYPIAQ